MASQGGLSMANKNDIRWLFTAYLDDIARHAKIDYIRRQRHKDYEISTGNMPEAPVSLDEQIRQSILSSDKLLIEDPALEDAFLALSKTRQSILSYTFVQNLTPQEISAILNCQVEYVYKQKHLALQQLRKLLDKGGGPDEPGRRI